MLNYCVTTVSQYSEFNMFYLYVIDCVTFSPNSLYWQEIHIYKHDIYKIIEASHSNVVIYVLLFSGCRSIAVTTYPFICAEAF